MENYNKYDDLLIRYLTNEVNADERIIVENWIGTSKENHQYFVKLQNAWQLASVKQTLDFVIDEMDVDQRWNQFKQKVTEKESRISEQEVYPVDERPFPKSILKRFLIPAAIAASLILITGLGWLYFFQAGQPSEVVLNTGTKDSLPAFVHHEVNTTGKEKRIQLPDGSLIVLADKSEITYTAPFIHKREITLTGKAYFNVAKHKAYPFSVISGNISTTALGTEFTVTSFAKNNLVTVRLYEGKVVVKSSHHVSKRLKDDIYLLPGQEFIYISQSKYKVRAFKQKNTTVPEKRINEEPASDDPSIPQGDEISWYMFNNQTLQQVLDELAALYNVEIVYNKKDVQNIYFTGHYNKSATLETILKRIGTLNNLKISKNDTAFVISR